MSDYGSSSAFSQRVRVLPPRAQLLLVAGAASLLLAVFGMVAVLHHWRALPPSSLPQDSPVPAGSFRPGREQWANLTIETVSALSFRAEQITDGYIANNDETTTPVFSPFSGRVTRLLARPGDVVKPGTPLMAVEATEFVQAQSDLAAAAAAIVTARAQLALAQTIEQRQHELFDARAAARKDWEQSQANLTAAQTTLRAADIALAAVRNRLRIFGKSDAEIAALETASDARRANPEALVYAPIGGVVTQRQIGVGQYINSGASAPVFTIGNLATVWLVANVREVDAPLVRVGQPVTVRVDAYPQRVFQARLVWVAPSIDPATHRLPVRAEIDNRDGALKPMMFATFTIQTGPARTAPAVPEHAVIYEGDAARVWVARDNDTLQLQSIQIGHSQDNLVEVVAGLRAGDRVVTAGTLFIDRAARGD